MQRRSAFGLALRLDREWAWCPERTSGAGPELTAELGRRGSLCLEQAGLGDSPYYASISTAENGRPTVRVYRQGEGGFLLLYSDETAFVVDAIGTEIHAEWPGSSTFEDTLIYLQGPILGFALRLRGVTCLHASAVAVDDRALAVVGSAGMGKSTTAAAFARRGFGVLTDDLLALDDKGTTFLVQPGLPRVLLWPESAEALWGDAEALPKIVPTWPKRYLDLTQPGYRFCSEPLPLGAIYVLGERAAPGSKTSIEPLDGTKALIHLVANTYANYLLDARMRAQELEVLGRLVTHVPVRLVHAPDDRKSVPAVCDAILEDFQEARTD